jgi:TIR domain
MIPYYIEIFADPLDERVGWLSEAIAQELESLGAMRTLSVECVSSTDPNAAMAPVCLYFVSDSFELTGDQESYIRSSAASGRVVIPIVDNLANFANIIPSYLRTLNAFAIAISSDTERLARLLLEEIGIEDKQRRAFISYRREDGLAAAEQLHDHLSQVGFSPFLDRFHIRAGRDLQKQIADQLEDCALLILLETPAAHVSPWVFDEVDYALSHFLGMQILTWPGDIAQLPGTFSLPRHVLTASDLESYKGYEVFTSDALERILVNIEAEHARALARRRRYLLVSAEEAAVDSGRQCDILPGWRLQVSDGTTTSLVQVTPRLPIVDDLFSLDKALDDHRDATDGILMHAARRLSNERRSLLTWASEFRHLTLVPENAIGAYWRS